MDSFLTLIQFGSVNSIFKIGLSVLLLLYTIFLIFVVNQVGSLNKLVFIRPANTSMTLFVIAIAQAVISFLLFLLSLAIL